MSRLIHCPGSSEGQTLARRIDAVLLSIIRGKVERAVQGWTQGDSNP